MKQNHRLLIVVGLSILMAVAGCSDDRVTPAGQVPQSQPHVAWNGDVDDSATVYVQGGKTWVDDVKGKPVQNTSSNFQGVLPSSDGTTVNLASKEGRGDVEVIQQPTKDNNYTAAVRILDPEPGKDHYKFVLTW